MVLDWPGKSPDLNPIDNFLATIMMAYLSWKECTMKTKLTEAILQVWYHNKEITGNYRQLVPNRVQELLKNLRGHKGY